MKKIVLLLVFSIVILGAPAVWAQSNDINIVRADLDPALLRNLSAVKWVGTWDYGIPSVLIIEKIDKERAQLIYKLGPAQNQEESSKRIEAKVTFADGGIIISWGKVAFYYTESQPNILKGMLVNYRGIIFIIMKRVQ